MFESKVVGMAPSGRLGVIRFLVVLCALVNVLFFDFELLAQSVRAWYQPPGIFQEIPFFPEWYLFNISWAFPVLKGLLIFFLLLALVGFQANFSVFISTGLYGLYLGTLRSSSYSLDNGILPLFLMFMLIWIPCGEGFSLDQRFRREYAHLKLDDRPSAAIGWSVFLIRAVIAFSFFQAAISKFQNTGFDWVRPWRIEQLLLEDSLTFAHAGLVSHLLAIPPIVWLFLGAAYWGLELFFPVILLVQNLRIPMLLSMVVLRSLVLAPQNIFFHDLILLQFVFYDWDRILPLMPVTKYDRRAGNAIFRGGEKPS